ncbi:MAG: VCBS repeat-containing protein, partial [Eubacteriales bacterium]
GNGNVHFFKNVGTAQAPAYATEVKVQAGGTNVQFGIRSVIRMFDWDGDGKMDLIGTGDTYAGWCRNIGSGTTPTLAAPVALQVPAASGSLANLSTGSRMRFDVTDWNHDGAPDLVIGDSSGAVFLFEGYRFGFQTLSCPAPGSVQLQQLALYSWAPFLPIFSCTIKWSKYGLANQLHTSCFSTYCRSLS